MFTVKKIEILIMLYSRIGILTSDLIIKICYSPYKILKSETKYTLKS